MTLYIRECKNSTRLKNNLSSCATQEQIDSFISDVFVDTLTIYDQLDFGSEMSGVRKKDTKPVFQQLKIINGRKLKKDSFVTAKFRIRKNDISMT